MKQIKQEELHTVSGGYNCKQNHDCYLPEKFRKTRRSDIIGPTPVIPNPWSHRDKSLRLFPFSIVY